MARPPSPVVVARRIVLVLVLAGVLGAGVLLVAVALDQPSRKYHSAVVVEAPREAIWALLTELDRYAEWNPYIIRSSGTATEGTDIGLTFEAGGSDPESTTAKVLIVHPMRKFEWETRTLVPGLLDREQIFRVIPDGPGRFRVVQDARLEGVLALFSDFGDHRAGLQAMLAAIARLAPVYQSSSP